MWRRVKAGTGADLGTLACEGKCRKTLETLMVASGSAKSPLPDRNDKISVFISEAGMYKLVLTPKVKHAEVFLERELCFYS
jgi:prophage antirepressor-like protein